MKNMGIYIVVGAIAIGAVILLAKLISGAISLVSGALNVVLGIAVIVALVIIVVWMFSYAKSKK